MAYVQQNFIPISMAVLLHAFLVVMMFFAPNFARPQPFTPMVLQGTVVQEIPETVSQAPDPVPEPVVEEPDPEPEPVVEEPEPEPEPDNSEELRRQAEEAKREQDRLIEEQRLEELRRQEEAEKRRREQEEADRKRREEEIERKRIEDERKRELEIQRQREENERRRREMEAERRAMEIADEERIAAENASSAMAVYMTMIRQKIKRSWAIPASFGEDDQCVVDLEQDRAGNVRDVRIVSCTTNDEAVRRSIIAAVQNASPLPRPDSPNLFRGELRFNMTKQ